jgi:YD repeat-containing protein
MKRLIKKILKEDREQMFLDKIVKVMKNDFPLFKNLKDYGFYEQLSEDELNYVLSGVFGKPVRYSDDRIGILLIYDENNNLIYSENSYGYWVKREYDENGNGIYSENSNGYWTKIEYDENGNEIYSEFSNGYWEKYEYDENGNMIYEEDSDGYWVKYEYDENGNMIYQENSLGEIIDKR